MSSRIEIQPNPAPLSPSERDLALNNPRFGTVFTDHMVTAEYIDSEWGNAVVGPYRALQLDPAASVLHYGQAIFEGFKAYRQKDGGVATFRPEVNERRFANSARRLAMPELPPGLFVAAADALILQDQHWVPSAIGESLYVRPLMIATEAALGVRPSRRYLFTVLASPAGAYFPKGMKPVSVWISVDYVRAAPGGTGDTKCAGNYAASLVAQRQALDEGCDQVVWLDAVERRYVEEMGGMNLFFVYQEAEHSRLVTPKLTGSLLPGVTRDSILRLAPELGYEVEERQLSVEQWQADLTSGRMTEVFACGTAAVITPVGVVKSKGCEWTVNGGETGPVAARLRDHLLAIQHGEVPDARGWMHRVVS